MKKLDGRKFAGKCAIPSNDEAARREYPLTMRIGNSGQRGDYSRAYELEGKKLRADALKEVGLR